ncbi:MAG: S26 family signal peptidase [Bryobacteraceae bacterium]
MQPASGGSRRQRSSVPPHFYFAMGDDRDNSLDRRYRGFVPRENIIGKPLIIYWSYDTTTGRLADPAIGTDHILDLLQHFFTMHSTALGRNRLRIRRVSRRRHAGLPPSEIRPQLPRETGRRQGRRFP